MSELRKPHREICGLCHEVSRIGFRVSDRVWQAALHQSQWNDIVCLSCFTKLADERGVVWDGEISFYPVSRVTHEQNLPCCAADELERLRKDKQQLIGWLDERTAERDRLKELYDKNVVPVVDKNIELNRRLNEAVAVLDSLLDALDSNYHELVERAIQNAVVWIKRSGAKG